MALTWLHQLKHQELGLAHRRAHPAAERQGRWPPPPTSCRSASATWRPSAQPSPPYQDWLEHSTPGDPWWDGDRLRARLEKVPPASLIGGWYDLFLPAQVADYEALRRAGRTARLTIGPWTHASPGLFAETVRDGPEWFEEQLGERRGPRAAGAVRVFVMGSRTWQEFSLWPPAGEAQRVVPRAAGARSARRRRRERPRPLPLQPARSHARRRRAVAQRPHAPAARTSAGASTATTC